MTSNRIPIGAIDLTVDCPMCGNSVREHDALCDCDTDALCIRCHRVYHVELGRSA